MQIKVEENYNYGIIQDSKYDIYFLENLCLMSSLTNRDGEEIHLGEAEEKNSLERYNAYISCFKILNG